MARYESLPAVGVTEWGGDEGWRRHAMEDKWKGEGHGGKQETNMCHAKENCKVDCTIGVFPGEKFHSTQKTRMCTRACTAEACEWRLDNRFRATKLNEQRLCGRILRRELI